MRINHIICDTAIEYENGARVRTSFVTNLDEDGTVMESAPALSLWINEAVDELHKRKTKKIPKYEYPGHVLTAARMQYYAKHGVELKINRKDCVRIPAMDAQRKKGKAIFGGGLLLSDKAAAERAAAERAAAERAAAVVWELSDREKEIVKGLG